MCEPGLSDAHHNYWWHDQQGLFGLHRRPNCRFIFSADKTESSWNLLLQLLALNDAESDCDEMTVVKSWYTHNSEMLFPAFIGIHSNCSTGAAGAEIFLPELQGLLKPMALQVWQNPDALYVEKLKGCRVG